MISDATLAIDFGTSNCTAFMPIRPGLAAPIPLEGEEFVLPSLVFTTRHEVAMRQVEQQEFTKRLRTARRMEKIRVKSGGVPLDDSVLQKNIEDVLIREARQEANRKY
jgi:hypothetical protein